MLPWIIAGTIGLLAIIALLQIQGKQKQLEQLTKNLEHSRSFADSLQRQLKESINDLERHRKESLDLREKQQSQRKKGQDLRDEIDKLKAQLTEARADSSHELELRRLREQVEEYQSMRGQLERERNQLAQSFETRMETLRSSLGGEKQKLEDETRQLKRELGSAQRRIKKLEEELNVEKKRIGAEESQLKRYQVLATNNDRAFRVTQNELHRAHRQIRELVEAQTQLRQQQKPSSRQTALHNLGVSDDALYESSPEEFIESLNAAEKKAQPSETTIESEAKTLPLAAHATESSASLKET